MDILERTNMIAKEYIGTPVVHQGRLKGIGIDCVGLVVQVGRELGYDILDVMDYPLNRVSSSTIVHFRSQIVEAPNILPGTIGIFWYSHRSFIQHAVIFSDLGMIHADESNGKVVEISYNQFWKRRLIGVYSWRLL